MAPRSELYSNARIDHRIICDIIDSGSRVLDLGCGGGELMSLLSKEKGAIVQGIELSEEAIYRCVENELSVFHGDIDGGLIEYPDNSFDYVILNQSMQEVKRVDYVISEALRVGKNVIVGFPNFAYFQARLRLFFKGKTPVTKSLPYRWYDTPNLHFLTISDFRDFCSEKHIKIIDMRCFGAGIGSCLCPNLLAQNAIFLITK